jgi:hypothetical protein
MKTITLIDADSLAFMGQKDDTPGVLIKILNNE